MKVEVISKMNGVDITRLQEIISAVKGPAGAWPLQISGRKSMG
jgi:hypothetical protein